MNARQAAQVDRWATEDAVPVPGQLELADGDPCALCDVPTRQWADLCDNCADAFTDLAGALAER